MKFSRLTAIILVTATVLTAAFVAYTSSKGGNIVIPAQPTHVAATNTVPEVSGVPTKIEPIPGWRSLTDSTCGINLQFPADWTIDGILDSYSLRSPDDNAKNVEYRASRTESGEGGSDLFYRSLYIDCYPDFKWFVADNFPAWHSQGEDSLSAFFDTAPFHAKDGTSTLLKKISLGGQTAYEIATTGRSINHAMTMYQLFVEDGKIYNFDLDFTEYDALSPAVKQILGTVVFQK